MKKMSKQTIKQLNREMKSKQRRQTKKRNTGQAENTKTEQGKQG